MKRLTRLTALLSLLAPLALAARGVQPADSVFRADEAARRLAEAGFTNVRAVETSEFTAFTVENDYYKIPAEGFARAVQILEGCALDESKPVKLIGTANKVPEVTMTYDPVLGSWSTTKRLDASWDAVRGEPVLNDSFGQVDIVVYPVVQLKNLIITQVYQSLWQLNPAVETSLWPGGKISLQVKIPILNDGYTPQAVIDRYSHTNAGFLFEFSPVNKTRIFSDRLFPDGSADVHFSTDAESLRWENHGNNGDELRRYHYHCTRTLAVRLLALDEGAWAYLSAVNRAKSRDGFNYLLVEPVVFPTNVEGGLGYLSVASATPLELALPEIDVEDW
jgi:hypothetical protein